VDRHARSVACGVSRVPASWPLHQVHSAAYGDQAPDSDVLAISVPELLEARGNLAQSASA